MTLKNIHCLCCVGEILLKTRIVLDVNKMDQIEYVIEQIDSWCIKNFGNDLRDWSTNGSISYDFSNPDLLSLFILRWGSYMHDDSKGIFEI